MAAHTASGRRAKGYNFQDKCADRIRAVIKHHFPISDTEVISTPRGKRGPDIQCSERVAKNIFQFACECKNHDRLSIIEWWSQAEYNATKYNLKPLLMFKLPRTETYVMLRETDFLNLLNSLYLQHAINQTATRNDSNEPHRQADTSKTDGSHHSIKGQPSDHTARRKGV